MGTGPVWVITPVVDSSASMPEKGRFSVTRLDSTDAVTCLRCRSVAAD